LTGSKWHVNATHNPANSKKVNSPQTFGDTTVK